MKIKTIIVFLFVSLVIVSFIAARGYRYFDRYRNSEQFRNLPEPEKKWVYSHPFIAKRAHEISNYSKGVAEEMRSSPILDGDKDGGQVDAFRHAYWMALLTREFGKKSALSLGQAHEDANYLDFLSRNLEDGAVPTHQGTLMDLANNRVGAEIGHKNRHVSDSAMVEIVIDAILTGKCTVLLKNKHGNYLDSLGEVIPYGDYKGQWETAKVLVPSNASRKSH